MNFRRGSDKKDDMGLNLTPLIDIIFLLLIFLMLSATTMQYSTSIKVNLPKAASDSSVIKKNIIITVNEKDRIYVDGKTINRNSLYGSLKNIYGIRIKMPQLLLRRTKNQRMGL